MQERKINFFEKLLLPVGAFLSLLGIYLIWLSSRNETLIGWARLIAVFLWAILLFVIILVAVLENVKEELSIIQNEQTTEIQILREIAHDQLQELKSVKQSLSKKR